MFALLLLARLEEVPASQLVCTALSEQRWCMHMQYGVGNIWYSMLSLVRLSNQWCCSVHHD
jgi:hypothetical protein